MMIHSANHRWCLQTLPPKLCVIWILFDLMWDPQAQPKKKNLTFIYILWKQIEAKLNFNSLGRKRHLFLLFLLLSTYLRIPGSFLTSYWLFISFHQPLSLVPALHLSGLAGELAESGFMGKRSFSLLKSQSILQKKKGSVQRGEFP